MSIMDKKDNTINIKDSFIDMYYNTNGNIAHKFGKIGSINFYTDLRLPNNMLLIHADMKVFEIEYETGDLPMKSFLSEALRRIEGHLVNTEKELKEVQEKKHKLWVDTDGKNSNKSYEINQKLDREEYARQLAERKNDQ